MAQRLQETMAAARKSRHRDTAKRLSQAWRWLSHGGGYFPSTPDVEFARDPAVQDVMATRALEMRASSGALAIRAASELSPVIRLPPRFAEVETTLQQLTQCYGGNSARRSEKLSKLKLKLVQQLADACPKELLGLVDSKATSVRIVSDLPLEWVPMGDGRPLMFKHQTSRIPCTPGNLMFQTLLPQPMLRLRASDLKKLLVIRALSTDDQLHSSLQIAFDGFCKNTPALDVSFVDVATSDELCAALSNFKGAWVIFDGHGQRTKFGSSLVVGSQQFDPWTLRGNTRVPQIVIPLACDTHPLSHNHSSAASGFLAAGARTCFGSLLPINGYTAARFVGRLVRAVNEMLPILFSTGATEITWANLFRIVHHSQFAHELLTSLSKGPEDPLHEKFLAVVSKTTLRSMGGDPGWYDECLEGFASAMEMTRADFEAMLASQMPVMDCMLYVQLGDPESILVCKDHDDRINAEKLANTAD